MYIGNSIIREVPDDFVIENIIGKNENNEEIIRTEIYTDGIIESTQSASYSSETLETIDLYIKKRLRIKEPIDSITLEKIHIKDFSYIIILVIAQSKKEIGGKEVTTEEIKDGTIYIPKNSNRFSSTNAKYEALQISKEHEWLEEPNNYDSLEEFLNRKPLRDVIHYSNTTTQHVYLLGRNNDKTSNDSKEETQSGIQKTLKIKIPENQS